MSTLPRFLALLTSLCLAGCPLPQVADCGDYDLCTPMTGSTSGGTGGAPTLPTGEIQTVTSDGEVTPTTSTTAEASTTGDPVVPAVMSVMFTPDPLEQVGIIDVEVVADADHVRMDRPGFASVELSKGPDEHFHGAIEVLSGLFNGTHEATFAPRQDEVEGATEIGYYTVALPEAGSEVLWDVIPDDGLGQVDALAVLGDDAIIGIGTVFDGNNTPRCYAHRRNLDGSYSGADVVLLFPEYPCTAIDIETDGQTIDLLVKVTGGDGQRWRVATMAWGQAPTVLRTGEKDEVAHALARDANGKRVVCGTGPSSVPLMDTIDGRVWTLNGPTVELDYQPNQQKWHTFDETVMDCTFRGDQLVLVGEVYGKHEEGNPPPPARKRPFVVELDSQGGEPPWIVPGLGPGNTTQGGASTVAIDDQGRAVVGLYICEDTCNQEPELWIYEPGGDLAFPPVTLPAGVSVPFGLTWSPAGYAVIAGALGTGNTTQFLLQGYVPGDYAPAWTFAKGKQAGLHIALAVVAAPGVVVGAGFGAGGYPAFAFVEP